jgi:hypothetical protein
MKRLAKMSTACHRGAAGIIRENILNADSAIR